jgi:GNAT superfamily N-acetyltransferase
LTAAAGLDLPPGKPTRASVAVPPPCRSTSSTCCREESCPTIRNTGALHRQPTSLWPSFRLQFLTVHSGVTVREASDDDRDFLVQMAASFGHGPNSSSVKNWLMEGWDFGWIVVDEAQSPVGAGWCRVFRGVIAGGKPDTSVRELFIGLRADRQDQGLGSMLLTKIIASARSDPAISSLVAMAPLDIKRGHRIRHMFWRRGFVDERTNAQSGVGVLQVLDLAPTR